jgi:hypothetical protein
MVGWTRIRPAGKMRGMSSRSRVPVVVLALVAMVCVGVWVVPAGAQSGSSRRAVLVGLHAGDQVVVSGTHVRCAVSSGLPRTIACGVGDAQNPFAGSYGVAVADQAALFLKASASRQPMLVLREAQPKLTVSSFPAATGKPRTLTVRLGTVLTVAGSHVFCAVTTAERMIAVTCGLTAAGSGLFIPGTYAGVVTPRYALLAKKLPGGKVKTVVQRKQP